MLKPPWKRARLKVTAHEFERMVVAFLQGMGTQLKDFRIEHQTPVSSPDGEFNIDATARFEGLGADFLVLVECKHHKDSIKRELVQVLADKVSAVRAQKGMLFSTAPFQSGAVEYAVSRRIALVHFTEGGPIHETRARDGPQGPKRAYDAYIVALSGNGGLSYRSGPSEKLADILLDSSDTG